MERTTPLRAGENLNYLTNVIQLYRDPDVLRALRQNPEMEAKILHFLDKVRDTLNGTTPVAPRTHRLNRRLPRK